MQENAGPEMVKSPVVGAAPEGAHDPRSAARAVREMFTSIAPRYDLLNHVLSFNIDRMWWRRTARTFRDILVRPDTRVLDLCCGTGDMTFALRRACRDVIRSDSRRRFLARDVAARRSEIILSPEEWVSQNRISTRLDRSRCSVPPIPQ